MNTNDLDDRIRDIITKNLGNTITSTLAIGLIAEIKTLIFLEYQNNKEANYNVGK